MWDWGPAGQWSESSRSRSRRERGEGGGGGRLLAKHEGL